VYTALITLSKDWSVVKSCYCNPIFRKVSTWSYPK